MKKIFGLLCIGAAVPSMLLTTYATNIYHNGDIKSASTQVVYTADNEANEKWSVTVPAKLSPGQSGTVTLEGTWSVDRYVTVTASQEIEMVNSINPADKKTLSIEFDKIGKRGNTTSDILVTQQISVEDISNALFGKWSGIIEYDAHIETRIVNLAGTTWQLKDVVNNYEWASTGEDSSGGFLHVSCNDEYCGLYNEFYSSYGAFSFHFDNPGDHTPVYLSEDSASMFSLPESGWYIVNSHLQSDFNGGNIEVLPELIASAQKCTPPELLYEDVENDYLRNLDIIDWLYDNAILN